MKYIGLLCLLMAALVAPTAGNAHSLVKCSTSMAPQKQLDCGEMNVHLGITTIRFLDHHPQAGTVKSRRSVSRSAAYLIRYGNRHVEVGLARQLYVGMPKVDSCLQAIITHEASGFRYNNPSTWLAAAQVWNGGGSGAYGIPQALPGSKMKSEGADWATNPATQVRWMIGYVNRKYGGSCSALSYWNSHRSY